MSNIANNVLNVLDTIYGEGHWWQMWAILLTICLVFCFRYSTRRTAICAFIGISIAMYGWYFVRSTYETYNPERAALSGNRNPNEHFSVRKHWLR